jgi:chemotaxis protein MotB
MLKQQEVEQLPDNTSNLREDPTTGTKPESPDLSVPDRQQTNLRPPTHDRRQFTVFQVDEFVFQQATTRTTHWSVPWSDLMMTMFILFLIMFVYQTAHKQILVGDETEVIGGETTGALDIAPNNKTSIPYSPIKPGLPLITAGTIKKAVPIHIYDIDGDARFVQDNKKDPMERIKKSIAPPSSTVSTVNPASEKQPVPKEVAPESGTELLTDQGTDKRRPYDEHNGTSGDEKTNKLLGIITGTIASYNLSKYASVDLVSGTDVRITLSSDLFFTAGKADLTSKSIPSLQKIGAAIKNIPFMIDVVGHTDNQPSHSDHFPSNWELSVARASSVVRFFIEETDMNPNQFMVSGYSSYRPLYPNSTMQNRAANRRIEVIISHRHPQQVIANKNQ